MLALLSTNIARLGEWLANIGARWGWELHTFCEQRMALRILYTRSRRYKLIVDRIVEVVCQIIRRWL